MVTRFVSVGDDFTLPPSVLGPLNATYVVPGTTQFARAKMSAEADVAITASVAAAQSAHATAPSLTEFWNDTSAWATGGSAFITSGQKLYGPTSGGDMLGRAAPVSGGRSLNRVIMATVTGGSERYTMAGWSSTAAGTAPDFNACLAVGFHAYPDGTATLVTYEPGGVITNVRGGLPMGDSWQFTIGQDETQSWVEMTTGDGSEVYKVHALKTTFTPAQIVLRTEVGRGTGGDNFGILMGRGAWASHVNDAWGSPSGIWGIEPVSGQPFHAWLPPAFDSSTETPLCILPHGFGGNETSGALRYMTRTDPTASDWAIVSALLDAGYIVANSAAHGGDNVGAGYPDYPPLWKYLKDRLPIGKVAVWSTSFGGPAGLRIIADGEVPSVAAFIGTFPVCSLAAIAYGTDGTLSAAINTRWGSIGKAQALDGDPSTRAATAFRGVPIHIRHSYADVTVSKADNTDALARKLRPFGTVTVMETVGPHGDPSNFTNLAANEIAFLNAALEG